MFLNSSYVVYPFRGVGNLWHATFSQVIGQIVVERYWLHAWFLYPMSFLPLP